MILIYKDKVRPKLDKTKIIRRIYKLNYSKKTGLNVALEMIRCQLAFFLNQESISASSMTGYTRSCQADCLGQFREIPWNQTTDVHRGSTLITRVIT